MNNITESIDCVHGNVNDQVQGEPTTGCTEDEVVERNWKFLSRDELIDTLREFYKMQGYAISISNSRKDKHVTIKCDRGGCYRNNWHVPMEHRQRKTSTRLIDCPFVIRGKKVDGLWLVEVKNNSHNHEPSTDMSGHPSCRRLSRDDILSIKEMTRAGTPPRQILSSLMQKNPQLQAVSRDIYNAKAKLQRENLAGRTMIQALFEELRQGDFIFYVLHNHGGQLTHLFVAHPSSIKLTQSYSNVFVMDCTYKTNKYKMSLLSIVGVSSFNTSFYSCFAFLEKEEEGDYTWALQMFSRILGSNCHPPVIVSDRELALMNALKVVFPTMTNILCVWHIEKNILSHCKSSFDTEDEWNAFMSSWKDVIASPDEKTYQENWNHFEILYKGKEKVLFYLKNTWLPFKCCFVRAWTDKFAHFGNRASSRVEGAHAKLKMYLQASTGDLYHVKTNICLAIEKEFKEFKKQLSSENIRIPHKCNVPFFKEIITNVSMFAMDELVKQYDMVKLGRVNARCTGNFNASMGLPCAHMMMGQVVLPIGLIHSQWRIDIRPITSFDGEQIGNEDNFKSLLSQLEVGYEGWSQVQKEEARKKVSQLVNPSIPIIFEPSIQIHKGRPTGSKKRKGVTSTTRNPSQFEIAQATRKCSLCNGVGHNSRTCPTKFGSHEGSSSRLTNSMDVFDLNTVPAQSNSFMFDW